MAGEGTQERKNIVILGGGGYGREVSWMIDDLNAAGESWNLIGFWARDEDAGGTTPEGIPVLGSEQVKEYLPNLYATAAIGEPAIRQRAVAQAEEMGCKFPVMIHPSVRWHPSDRFGQGANLHMGSILSTNITVGAHAIINGGCILGHDCVIEDFVTLSPGCLLMGKTIVGRGAFLGVGAMTTENRKIGEGAVIGAGGVVVKDVPAGVTAVGVPAKPLQ